MNEEKKNSNALKRLNKIDFLRGIAVILVLLNHFWLFDNIQKFGWIGVDLFFVLSGFLVSGLLFSEYKIWGKIRPGYFLIRRGFKIYPIFYFSLILTFALIFIKNINGKIDYNEQLARFLPEIFFLQNYFEGIWGHHWSLAVEEHFYILLSILVFILAKKNFLLSRNTFYTLALIVFLGCLVIRLYPIQVGLGISKVTHARIDSLFAGVFISYFYHFEKENLAHFFRKFKVLIYLMIPVPLFFTPFISIDTYFMQTFGFTIIYICFSCLLLTFLFDDNIDQKLTKVLGKHFYTIIISIGFYSYSIYLFHLYFIKIGFSKDGKAFSSEILMSFIIYFCGSILMGIIISKLIENPFLKLRDKYFPRLSNNEKNEKADKVKNELENKASFMGK